MEEVDMEPEKASENQEAENGVSTQEAEEPPSLQVNEELKDEPRESHPQEELVEKSEKRDLPMLVTNIKTAAETREARRRAELEEVRRLRYEQLEVEYGVKANREKIETIVKKWTTPGEDLPQELLEEFNTKQKLYAAIIEDKMKHINATRQKLKATDERFIKDLRKQEEELELIMKRSDDHIKILTKANREELCQIERILLEESEILFTREKTEWEQCMKKLWETELKKLKERREKVEEYEVIIQNLRLRTRDMVKQTDREAVRERLQKEAAGRITRLKSIREDYEAAQRDVNLAKIKRRILSMEREIKELLSQQRSQEKQFTKSRQSLAEDYKRTLQQYEGMQKKVKHFAVTHSRRFWEMWQMADAEVKQLVERVLYIDSQIHRQLGLPWERPPMPFMEYSGPSEPQKQTRRFAKSGQALQRSQRIMDASAGPRLETDTDGTDVEICKEGTVVQSESGAEKEEGKKVKKVMELLCDEAGFLMEDKLLDLLTPEEKEEQTVAKLCSLLSVFGIQEKDIPKLAHFFLKYKHQQREQQIEDIYVESGKSSDKAEEEELIDANHAVPALKSFLEQHTRSRQCSARQHRSFQLVEVRDTSADKSYWESMGNIISEDKLKFWDTAEKALKRYHTVLTDISDLVPETQRLEQENKELKMLLQKCILNSEEKY